MEETSLIKLDAFRQALVEAKTIPEVKNLRDQAATFKEWLKKRGANRLEKNAIAELQIWAERKLGVMLEDDPDIHPGGDQKSNLDNQRLILPKKYGISYFQSHWWQLVADILEDDFNTYVSEINADEDDKLPISTLGFIRWNLRKHKPESSGDWLPLPEGKYRTLVIDPPWPMQRMELDERTPEMSSLDYDVKTIDNIIALDIASLCSDDGCHAYLWTTQKYLPITSEILQGWGLQHIFTMTWHKSGGFQPVGLPQYNSEFILFGRTNGLVFLNTKDFFTCFNGKRREHSRKPEEFYQLVARVSPRPRLDIFSREKHQGFEQYGNEKGKFNNEHTP